MCSQSGLLKVHYPLIHSRPVLDLLVRDEAVRLYIRFPPFRPRFRGTVGTDWRYDAVPRYRLSHPEGTPFSLGGDPPPHYGAVLEPR